MGARRGWTCTASPGTPRGWGLQHLLPLPRRVNVGCGPAEERVLLTGLHAVADIYCENCKTTLGWKYVSAASFGHLRDTQTYPNR